MAAEAPPPHVDRRSGFCAATKTFHSIRPPLLPLLRLLPPPFLPPPLPSHPALLDAANGDAVSYPDLLSQIRSLSAAVRSTVAVSKGDVAFVLAPPRLEVPVLYFALLSLGVVVSPANPVSTSPEISRLVRLSKPSVAFATSSTAHKLPPDLPAILLDSPRFRSLLKISESDSMILDAAEIRQSDSAAIPYSSGTTGPVKGVLLIHRNLVAVTALLIGPSLSPPSPPPPPPPAASATLLTVPLFHIYGFMLCLKAVAAGETAAIETERFDAKRTLAIVERFRITHLALAPPALLALVRIREAEAAAEAEDVTSLQAAFCGGAPIGTDLIRRFLSSTAFRMSD